MAHTGKVLVISGAASWPEPMAAAKITPVGRGDHRGVAWLGARSALRLDVDFVTAAGGTLLQRFRRHVCVCDARRARGCGYELHVMRLS